MTHPSLRRGTVLLVLLGLALAGSALDVTRAAASGSGGFSSLATFDGYRNGSLRGQGPWSVNTTGDVDGALVSDTPPGALSGKAMVDQLTGFDEPVQYRGNAYAGLGDLSVPDGSGATYFTELLPTDLAHTDLHLGLSANPTPGLGGDTTGRPYRLDDFGPEVTLDRRGLVARDGGTDRVLTGVPVADGALLRLWIGIDTATDTFQVHAQAPGQPTTLLSAQGRTTFAFRSPGTQPLVTLLLLNDDVDVPSSDTYLDTMALAPASDVLDDPSPSWSGGVDVDALDPGSLGTRGGWRSAGASVVTDPSDPDNRVVRVSGAHAYAEHPLPAIADGDTGTLFFRARRAGDVNAAVGLSDVDASGSNDDFRAQVNSAGGSSLTVRDGDRFSPAGSWADGAWQCFWVVADNGADQVSLYSRGGPYRTLTRLPEGAGSTWSFRSATSAALDQFLARSSAAGTTYLDDMTTDSTHVDLSVPSGDATSCPYSGSRQGLPVPDPAPQVAQPARLQLGLTKVAQVPSVSTTGRAARINFATTMPGSDRLAVPDLDGVLSTAEGGTVTPYLDVRQYFPDLVTSPGLGTGLGSVAFDPEFARTGIFYTVHTEAGDALRTQTPTLDSPADAKVQGVITQWVATDPTAGTFSGTHRQVLRIGFSEYTHGIQQIAFDPYARPGDEDYRLLYVGVGDGDETPVFSSRPQDLSAPQGKVLRIDPLAPSGATGYAVPSDNPFVGTAGALPEVYARGLRNPHRFSWDPTDGRMFLGNIGEKRIDSVYQVLPGDNFGWNEREGHFRFDPDDPTNVYPLPSPDTGGYTYPVLQIGRDAGTSLVGGFVYRGKLPALRGRYVFGDIVSGEVRETPVGLLDRAEPEPAFHDVRLVIDGHVTTLRSAVHANRVDLRFGQDAAGELYVLSKAVGTVWKVTSATSLVPPAPTCAVGHHVLRPPATRASWKPAMARLWRFGHGQVRLVEPGPFPGGGPRRPRAVAVLTAGPRLTSFDAHAQVRIDRDPKLLGRDVILVLNYRDPTHYEYVHLSNDTGSYTHNGIFVVDGSDRRRIDDQWTGHRSAPAAIPSDRHWHGVRVRYCAGTGQVGVYLDGARRPLMTATDTALVGGRLGFGSFDDYGRLRRLTVRH